MSDINKDHFIQELLFVLENEDLIKARFLLSHITDLDADSQHRVIFELSRHPDDFSITLLGFIIANVDESVFEREVLYKALFAKILNSPLALIDLLKDPGLKRKNLFIELAGELQPMGVTSQLSILFEGTSDHEILRSISNALVEIGDHEAVSVISPFLRNEDEYKVELTIRTLVNINSPEAYDNMYGYLGADPDLDEKILMALWKLGSIEAIEIIVKAIHAHNAGTRNMAKELILDLGLKAVPHLINNLSSDDNDFVIQALDMLGAIGDKAAIKPVKALLHKHPADANIRFAAYEALGKMPFDKGMFTILEGLTDPNDLVCVAAAQALNRNYNSLVLAGITNLVEENDDGARRIVRAFIDSESDNIVTALIENEVFQSLCLDYLLKDANPDSVNYYQQLFNQHGLTDLASRLTGEEKPEPEKKLLLHIVDDSKTILNIYRQVLFSLGIETVLFEFPEEALLKTIETKPDLLITDLNMPVMNGVELTIEVRKHYSEKELPIMMVSTQSDEEDKQTARDAGINHFLNKPFTKEQLEEAINSLTG